MSSSGCAPRSPTDARAWARLRAVAIAAGGLGLVVGAGATQAQQTPIRAHHDRSMIRTAPERQPYSAECDGASAHSMVAIQPTVDVVVLVDNVRNAHGRVRMALWDRAEAFLEAEQAVANGSERAVAGRLCFVVSGLPTGRYAAAVYHDENDNEHMDRSWVGWPREGLGFSRQAWIRFGPPSFDAAAVPVDPQHRLITVRLRY